MKIGHIGVPVEDIEKAKNFYDAVAASLAMQLIAAHEDFVGYGSDSSFEFYVHTGRPGLAGLHVCFEVTSREMVEDFYHAALDAGGVDNGAPGIREDYSPTYFAAFVIDPDGNNIEAVFRG